MIRYKPPSKKYLKACFDEAIKVKNECLEEGAKDYWRGYAIALWHLFDMKMRDKPK